MAIKDENKKLIPTLFDDLGQFFADLFSGKFFRTVSGDLKDLREFYLDQDRKNRLERMSKFRSWFVISFWLLKGLILKLSSFRRILFLLAFVFILSSAGETGDNKNKVIFGVLIFIFLLLLELKDKLLARQELEAGRAVQNALLPDECPEVVGWDIWLFSKPANEVGGDLVDFIPINKTGYGIVIGDVAGKGLGAALFMAKLQATIRALVFDYKSPVEIAVKMNRIFYRDTLANSFSSMVYLEINPQSGKVRFVNAGHMPPLFIQGEIITEMAKGSQALGLIPDVKYVESQVELRSGDYFFIYSDGLSEARNKNGIFYGESKIFSLVAKFGSMTTKAAGKSILDDVTQFTGGSPQSDDMSLIILKRL